jgi:peroxiredoxin
MICFIVITHICYSQQSERISITGRETLTGKVYNKQTGVKLSDEELAEIVRMDPNAYIEGVIGSNGKVTKYYYDPRRSAPSGMVNLRNVESQTKEGEQFPDFTFETISKEIIKSKDLEGSWILVRFEVLTRLVNIEEILKLNDQIKDLSSQKDITAIICFADTRNNVVKFLQDEELTFELVSDGRNFHERYNIINYPCTILVDDEGTLVKYFYNGDRIDLKDLMQN